MCLDLGLLVSSYSPEHRNPKPEGEEFIPKMRAPPLPWEKVLCVDDIHYDDVCAKSQITLDLWKERFGGRSSTFVTNATIDSYALPEGLGRQI